MTEPICGCRIVSRPELRLKISGLLLQGYTFKGQTHIFPVMPGESGSFFNSSQNPCNARCAGSLTAVQQACGYNALSSSCVSTRVE